MTTILSSNHLQNIDCLQSSNKMHHKNCAAYFTFFWPFSIKQDQNESQHCMLQNWLTRGRLLFFNSFGVRLICNNVSWIPKFVCECVIVFVSFIWTESCVRRTARSCKQSRSPFECCTEFLCVLASSISHFLFLSHRLYRLFDCVSSQRYRHLSLKYWTVRTWIPIKVAQAVCRLIVDHHLTNMNGEDGVRNPS